MLKYNISPENLTLREAKEKNEAWDDFIKRKNKIEKEFKKALK